MRFLHAERIERTSKGASDAPGIIRLIVPASGGKLARWVAGTVAGVVSGWQCPCPSEARTHDFHDKAVHSLGEVGVWVSGLTVRPYGNGWVGVARVCVAVVVVPVSAT